ncbi:MAG: hypothetical protein JWN86_383 [Planctomycetota bacterium]|nr:hypothetical protein [Planctomycetota bacterium]
MSLPTLPGGRARAIWNLRCPVCGVGPVFRSPFTMNERCPHCGEVFGRGEPGYFLGAMYFSYGLGVILITTFTGIIYLYFRNWRLWQLITAGWILFLPLVPAVYRYSRVLWLHFDRVIDPSD